MRPILDILRRGFDNVVANWPLMLIRLGESVALVAIVLAGLAASVIPYLFSGVIDDLRGATTPREVLQALVLDHPFAILFWFFGFSLTLAAAILLHSFVSAGVIGVYVEGEAAAGAEPAPPRARFDRFTPERWLAHAKRGVWPLFWIYNIIWGIASVILLLPVAGAVALVAMASESPDAMVAITCASIALLVLAAVVVSMIAFLWSQLSIIAAMRDSLGAIASIGAGLSLFRTRFGGVVLTAIVVMIVSMAIGGAFSGVYVGIGLASSVRAFAILTIPLQIVLSLVQSAISVFTSSWLVAALVAVLHD